MKSSKSTSKMRLWYHSHHNHAAYAIPAIIGNPNVTMRKSIAMGTYAQLNSSWKYTITDTNSMILTATKTLINTFMGLVR
mmetsp:Transcript_41047/g.47695  ORF Transcript_41047/g.47695 Transcript_41047/m.47695 type:complete len:80 (-) Transcript_41047:340-579(-)